MVSMSYDVIVIGSGPGGYSAAVRAGQYGLKTALIEKTPKLGGTCLLVGCIPTKALLHTAEVWDYFQHSEEQGIHCQGASLDLPKVLARKQGIVDKHSKGVSFLMKKNKVDVIAGFAKLKGGGKSKWLRQTARAQLRPKPSSLRLDLRRACCQVWRRMTPSSPMSKSWKCNGCRNRSASLAPVPSALSLPPFTSDTVPK
jgi:choline dehydrogenase-like flavoprotein